MTQRLLQDILGGRDRPHGVAPLSDHEAWQVYVALTLYGVPAPEAQVVIDALAQRPAPHTRPTPEQQLDV